MPRAQDKFRHERRVAARFLPGLRQLSGHRCHWCRAYVVIVRQIPKAQRLKLDKWSVVYMVGSKKLWHARATVDHVVPLGEGGSSVFANLVCACAKCNDSRNLEQIKRHRERFLKRVLGKPETKSARLHSDPQEGAASA